MSGRNIAQILITGTQIIGKAFVEAYRVAAASAKQNSNKSIKDDADAKSKQLGITLEEACQILNVEKSTPLEKTLERYQTMFKINDPKAGGSFYLQSKIFRAKERIEMELQKEDATPQENQQENQTGDKDNK